MMAFLALMTMLTAGFGFIGCNKEEEHPVDCDCSTCNHNRKYDAIICLWSDQGDEWIFPIGQDYLEVEYAYDGTERKITRGVYKMPDNPAPDGGWLSFGGANICTWEGSYRNGPDNGWKSQKNPIVLSQKGEYCIVVRIYGGDCKDRRMELNVKII